MTAFMLVCYLGLQVDVGIYFKNINDCIDFKKGLHNQVIMKDNKEELYQCMCKLVPNIDADKVRIY